METPKTMPATKEGDGKDDSGIQEDDDNSGNQGNTT
jgi:hypothetical protein